MAVRRGQHARLAESQLGLFQLGARHRDGGFGLLDARAVQGQPVFDALHGPQRLVALLLAAVAVARRNGALARQFLVAPQVLFGDGQVGARQVERFEVILAPLLKHGDFFFVLDQAGLNALHGQPEGAGINLEQQGAAFDVQAGPHLRRQLDDRSRHPGHDAPHVFRPRGAESGHRKRHVARLHPDHPHHRAGVVDDLARRRFAHVLQRLHADHAHNQNHQRAEADQHSP